MKKRIFSVLASTFLSYGATADSTLKIESESIKADDVIPLKYSMYGENISPELHWHGIPPDTKALVISCIDVHPIAKQWIHWIVINLPPQTSSLPEGASNGNLPDGSFELKNSFGAQGYGGPRPPAGTGTHKYVFTIYALKNPVSKLKLGTFFTAEQLQNLLQNNILEQASFSSKYTK